MRHVKLDTELNAAAVVRTSRATPPKKPQWLREGSGNDHAGVVGHTCVMVATRDDRHDEGVLRGPRWRTGTVSPIRSDGVDPSDNFAVVVRGVSATV